MSKVCTRSGCACSSHTAVSQLLKDRTEPKAEDRGSVELKSKGRVDDILVTQPRIQAGKEGEPVEDFHIVFFASPGKG